MSLGDITNTMQILLGSAYVNDFDFNNRSYRVYVQADQQFRSNPGDIERYSRADRRRADDAAQQRRVGARGDGAEEHQPLQPVPLGRDQRIGGAGLQLGAGAAGDGAAVATARCRRACRYAWSGLSLEEIKAGSQSAAIFGLGLLLVYLTLAGAVREPDAAVHHPAVGAAGDPGRAARRSGAAG